MAYSVIDKSSSFMNPVLYTGNATARSITGVGFQPDLLWIKDRTNANSHMLADAVRGATKYLVVDGTYAESTDSNRISAFDSDGFSIGTNNNVNQSLADDVAWNWKAGTTSGIDTTGATITPTGYSFNATSKMSIIKYTGNDTSNAAVPHGLGVVPNCIIVKDLSGTEHWAVVTTSMTAGKMMYLNLDNAEETSQFGSTANTSVLFHLGTNAMVNSSTKNYIAYCFADVDGYSKFSSYEGNNNADGTFIYTGFKPAFLVVKRTDSANNWTMYDNKRSDGFNANTDTLIANDSAAELTSTTNDVCDFLSNGVKMRCSNNGSNGSSASYIYMAFGQPIISNGGVCATAR